MRYVERVWSEEITPGTVLTEEARMQMEMHSHTPDARSDARSLDAALDRLRQDLRNTPPEAPTDIDDADVIDYASLEFEVERMRKRLAIWEIFMGYMRHGARTWPEVQEALTDEDFKRIGAICDGVPLHDLLLDMR